MRNTDTPILDEIKWSENYERIFGKKEIELTVKEIENDKNETETGM